MTNVRSITVGSLIPLLLLLVSDSISVPATVVPSNVSELNRNLSFPVQSSIDNVTNIALPPWPAGLATTLSYNRAKPLNRQSFLTLGVKLMYSLSKIDWESLFPSDSGGIEEDDNVAIYIGPQVINQPRAPNRLKIGYAILALYQTLTGIILQNSLYDVESEIRLQRSVIGSIVVYVRGEENHVDHASPANMTDAFSNDWSSLASRLKASTGSIIDGDDATFKLTYTYDETHPIDAQDLFMAVLDALANAAKRNPDEPCSSDRGVSLRRSGGQAGILIFQSGENPGTLSYDRVKRGLYLAWDQIMLPGRRFGAMSVILEYAGSQIGTFWVETYDPVSGVAQA